MAAPLREGLHLSLSLGVRSTGVRSQTGIDRAYTAVSEAPADNARALRRLTCVCEHFWSA